MGDSQCVRFHSHQTSVAASASALTLGMGQGSIIQRQDQRRQPVWIFHSKNSKTLSEQQRWCCHWRLVWMELKCAGISAGVVSFTDPPVLTWHRPIYFSYLAVVSGTLPQHKGQKSNLLGASLKTWALRLQHLLPFYFLPSQKCF